MKKLILAGVVALGVLHASAQNKFGYINTQEVLSIMPEAETAQNQLKDYQASLGQQGQDLGKEADEKSAQFIKDSATLTASMKEIKRKELFELIQKVNNWQNIAQDMYNQKLQTLLEPINAKAFDAIKAVAKENNYTYVFDVSTNALLVMPPGDDLINLVKKKLGIKDAPAAPAPGKTPAKTN